MKRLPAQGLQRVEVRKKHGEFSTSVLEIRYRRLTVCPSIGKQKQYPNLILTAIHAREKEKPKGLDKIDWKVLTDLPVRSSKEAAESWTSMHSGGR